MFLHVLHKDALAILSPLIHSHESPKVSLLVLPNTLVSSAGGNKQCLGSPTRRARRISPPQSVPTQSESLVRRGTSSDSANAWASR